MDITPQKDKLFQATKASNNNKNKNASIFFLKQFFFFHLRAKIRSPAPPTEKVLARQRKRLFPRVFVAADAARQPLVAPHGDRPLVVQPDPHLLHHTFWGRIILHTQRDGNR